MLIEDKRDYSLQLFGKVQHGFALRGNQEDPYERELCLFSEFGASAGLINKNTFTDNCPGWVKEQSLRGIADWFDLWLG